jgi:transcriptional regulator with XRE-family HTH domain
MGKTLQDIWEELPEERQQKIENRFQQRLQEYQTLQELRNALELTQEDVAQSLEIHQVNVSKMERRSDLKLSTLREYLSALGGELRLIVDFPGKPSVLIQGLGEGEEASPNKHRRPKMA